MKYSEKFKIENASLEERGLSKDSYFEILFQDGSIRDESDMNWSDVSEQQIVSHGGQKKVAYVCIHPIKRITIHHNGLETFIEPKEGEQVYQSVISISSLRNRSFVATEVVGRKVGLVKDGIVTEEMMIDERSGNVEGIKL